MRKIIGVLGIFIIMGIALYFTFLYNANYSEGVRSGELIKFSRKGIVFKTYEGQLSQGLSGAQIFSFSVLDSNEKVISNLKVLEGRYVKLSYIERYKTFPWWGDTKYFIVEVKEESSPFKIKK